MTVCYWWLKQWENIIILSQIISKISFTIFDIATTNHLAFYTLRFVHPLKKEL
jgi:hypothetical protein